MEVKKNDIIDESDVLSKRLLDNADIKVIDLLDLDDADLQLLK